VANRPDIIIKNKEGRICLLIDVAKQYHWTEMQKEAEKIKK
jgi:hypothetical protein